MIEVLAQIRAPKPKQFVAGLVLWDGIVVEAAPIIYFMKRGKWTRSKVREYCEAKGWTVSVVHEVRRGSHGAEGATRSGA
jgi:hypothetical protein